jgi:hypothetical protein
MSNTGAEPNVVRVPDVELVFDPDCPHAGEARLLLRRAMITTGLAPTWREWMRDSADTPPSLRGLGSPTILVDGTDVSTAEPATVDDKLASSCRIYYVSGRLTGVPSLEAVVHALQKTRC